MHGGTSQGGPRGERNGAYKHGCNTQDATALRRSVSRLLKVLKDTESMP